VEAVYDRLGALPARIVAGTTLGLHQPSLHQPHLPPIVFDKSPYHHEPLESLIQGCGRCRFGIVGGFTGYSEII